MGTPVGPCPGCGEMEKLDNAPIYGGFLGYPPMKVGCHPFSLTSQVCIYTILWFIVITIPIKNLTLSWLGLPAYMPRCVSSCMMIFLFFCMLLSCCLLLALQNQVFLYKFRSFPKTYPSPKKFCIQNRLPPQNRPTPNNPLPSIFSPSSLMSTSLFFNEIEEDNKCLVQLTFHESLDICLTNLKEEGFGLIWSWRLD